MYTWNKNWIFPNESPWGIINKFLYANEIKGSLAIEVLTTGKARVLDKYRVDKLHTGIVANYKLLDNKWLTEKTTLEEYGSNLLKKILHPLLIQNKNLIHNENLSLNCLCRILIRKNLYYCPECMKYGNHLMIHQFTFIEKCPIHNIQLKNICPKCGEEMPYEIIFNNKTRAFASCKCGYKLFDNENFETVVTNWMKKNNKNYNYNPAFSQELLTIITNNQEENLNNKDINNYLFAYFTKTTNNLKPKYIISKGMDWNTIDFGDVISPNLNSSRDMVDYAYYYAFQKLYRHIARAKHLRSRIDHAETFMNRSLWFSYLANQNDIKSKKIIKYHETFDKDAVILYLWKRDMEYNLRERHLYIINRRCAYWYKFAPDPVIYGYVQNVKYLLPDYIDDDMKFSIMVHIALTLMNDRYVEWEEYVNNIKEKKKDIWTLRDILDLSSLRLVSDNCKKQFLLKFDRVEHTFNIFFSIHERTEHKYPDFPTLSMTLDRRKL